MSSSCTLATDLGFFVAVDGALRLPRNLPAGALVTFAPPGSFYQVRQRHPLPLSFSLRRSVQFLVLGPGVA